MRDVPPLSCDCHMHVFGPPATYRGSATRAYTPTERSLAQYQAVAGRLGLRRVVFVQPSAYGTDNACMLDALSREPERFRGVAVIDAATGDEQLRTMHRLGVRGIRLNLVTEGSPDTATAQAALAAAAKRVAPLGWHIQVYASAALIGTLVPTLRRLGVPVVLDHMAGADAALGLEQPGFPAILDLLAAGGCWVKLSGADRVTGSSTDFSPAAPYARALIAANSHNLVWGTDWPHLGHHDGGIGAAAPPAIYRDLDDTALLGVLAASVDDAATWQRILADNPGRLYAF